MIVKYRIDNLELRLRDVDDNDTIHSPWSEIVKWNKREESTLSDKKYCYTLATYEYDRDGWPELRFCSNRPCDLSKEDMDAFIDLVKEGYMYRKKNGKLTKIQEEEEYFG